MTDPDDGDVTAAYRYTAYGSPDFNDNQGEDTVAQKDDTANPADPTKDALNPYRYSSKRIDSATGDYDMGFRNYSPGLNRFLTRDMYNGALGDLKLGMDPWNTNRYAFAGGNPITRIELDGHRPSISPAVTPPPPLRTCTTAISAAVPWIPRWVGLLILLLHRPRSKVAAAGGCRAGARWAMRSTRSPS